jgi:hypothetical protein
MKQKRSYALITQAINAKPMSAWRGSLILREGTAIKLGIVN